jgi:hypothetical protein
MFSFRFSECEPRFQTSAHTAVSHGLMLSAAHVKTSSQRQRRASRAVPSPCSASQGVRPALLAAHPAATAAESSRRGLARSRRAHLWHHRCPPLVMKSSRRFPSGGREGEQARTSAISSASSPSTNGADTAAVPLLPRRRPPPWPRHRARGIMCASERKRPPT